MAFELTLSNGEPLEFRHGLPANYKGTIFKDAVAASCKTNLVSLVRQEIRADAYSIRLTEGNFLQQLSTVGRIDHSGLYSFFMLKNGIRKDISTLGKFHLREDQYSCLYLHPTNVKSSFEKNRPFRLLDIFYSPCLLHELYQHFPRLKDIAASEEFTAIPENKCWAPTYLSEVLHQLIYCPFDNETRQFYFDLKVREILYHMLEFGFKERNKQMWFTPWEVARIHEVRNILKSYITQKPPTLKQLSKMVALNEFKLKKGFRQYFHCGMFQWLHAERMRYAKEQILHTDKQIQDISLEVGYPRSSNFITAFRNYFGVTPASLRRK